jgi:ribonuclease HI
MKMELNIWTDGSHIKGTSVMGYGAYAEAGGIHAELSKRIIPPTSENISNPTMEVAAAFCVAMILLKNKEHLHRFGRIVIRSDYNGVINYANGVWNPSRATTKTPIFRSMAMHWANAVTELRKICQLDVEWVRGHSGDRGNSKADALAKSVVERNTFYHLFH